MIDTHDLHPELAALIRELERLAAADGIFPSRASGARGFRRQAQLLRTWQLDRTPDKREARAAGIVAKPAPMGLSRHHPFYGGKSAAVAGLDEERPMSSHRIDDLDPEMQPSARRVEERMNIEIAASLHRPITGRITITRRDPADQAVLYDKGRKTVGELCTRTYCNLCGDGGLGHIVTNAKPGSSYHEYGRAFDVMLFENGKLTKAIRDGTDPAWQIYGAIVESEGLCWGGKWRKPDLPHAEMHPPGLGCRDAATLRPPEIA